MSWCAWALSLSVGCGVTTTPIQGHEQGSGTTGAADEPHRPDVPPGLPVGSTSGGEESSSGELEPGWVFDVNVVPDPVDAVCDTFELDPGPRRVPTDMIMIVDGSGSMVEEAAQVEARLNGLITGLLQEGVDTRVVLLARSTGSTGMCIGAPAGSGQCPDDSNEPGFRHIDVDVGSWEPLQVLIDLYPDYADMLRPGARRQLVVVSDDNSFALDAGTFQTEFEALDPWNEQFVLHAVVGQTRCAQTVSLGAEYLALAEWTGGSVWDLCAQEFGPSFDGLRAEATAASESCAYPLADVDGWPARSANVTLELGGLPLDRLDAAEACARSEHGWFVGDLEGEPTLQLCPASCERALVAQPPRLDGAVLCDEIPG